MAGDDTTNEQELRKLQDELRALKEENRLLRESSRLFGDLAERLHDELLVERRKNGGDRRSAPRDTPDRRQRLVGTAD